MIKGCKESFQNAMSEAMGPAKEQQGGDDHPSVPCSVPSPVSVGPKVAALSVWGNEAGAGAR